MAHDEAMPRTSTPAAKTTTEGVRLVFETIAPVGDAPAPLRISPDEATLLRVIDGLVSLSVADDQRVLGIGDEAIVPAGHPHRIASIAGDARLVMGFRSAPL
jgi:mannose-6-phosphate isomerase-like protein (cupin superfamily)